MCKERKNSLSEQEQLEPNDHNEAEGIAQSAEIIHQDGSRELVELKAQRVWSGALPRPQDFARYGEILPDAPERILRLAEREQEHRIESERSIISQNFATGTRGQWLGAALSCLALLLAVFSAWLEAPWPLSTALVGVPVLSVARSLVLAVQRSEPED